MASIAQTDAIGTAADAARPRTDAQPFFSISDLAARWRVSRSAVYGYLRGYQVIDFAPAPGRKGHKLVSAEIVRQIEWERLRMMR